MSAFDYGRFQSDAFQIDPVTLQPCDQDYVEAGYVEAGYVCGVSATAKRGGGLSSRRKRPVWMEHEGEILVFRNATDAAQYLQQEKAKTDPQEAPKRLQKARKEVIKPLEKIDLSMLEGYKERLRDNFPAFVSVAEAKQDIGLLLELVRRAREWQDEDDLEVLLLAA